MTCYLSLHPLYLFILVTAKINKRKLKSEVRKIQNIIIKTSDVWSYFNRNRAELETTMMVIAENPEYGVIIYLSSEDDLPMFTVTADGYTCKEETAVSANKCREIAQRLYEEYLTEKFLNLELFNSDYDESLLDIEDRISERELELDDVISLLISTAIDEDYDILGSDLDDICEDIKDHILEYMARKHGLAVRRPMILEDENGEEFFEEYPYEYMEFDNEDNPIYQK